MNLTRGMLFRLFKAINARRTSTVFAVAVCVLLLGAHKVSHHEHASVAPGFFVSDELGDEDVVTYRAIFQAQNVNDWDGADKLIETLHDQRLLGSLLADRYLNDHYSSSADELSTWLQNYADQPEAERIARIAAQKGVNTTKLASSQESIKGAGNVDRIGNQEMPQRWYHGLSLWRSGDYKSAATAFNDVAETPKLSSWHVAAARFWQARALEKTGERHAARQALKAAAESPLTFYGMLANAKLGNTLDLTAEAPYVPDSIRKSPAALRAEGLSQVGEFSRAETELRYYYGKLNDEDRASLITLASEFNLPNLQVRLGRIAGLSDEQVTFANYPMPQWLSEEQSSLDSALLYAISRQESSFIAEARSGAGATGLMQLMPTTANYVWKQSADSLIAAQGDMMLPEKTSKLALSDLHDPRTNLLLGQEYLHTLMRDPKVGDNLVHLIAAYNAGPGMVAVWNKSGHDVKDPLLYIESIPYGETRNYVMQVFTNYWVYRTLMGESSDTLDALANQEWPVVHNG